MRKLSKASAVMRPKSFTAGVCILLLVFLLSPGLANAQAKDKSPAPDALYERVSALDAALFAAYNKCDIDKVGTFFAEDLEFYHEKGGLTLTRDAILAVMRKNLCGEDSNRVRRVLSRGAWRCAPSTTTARCRPASTAST